MGIYANFGIRWQLMTAIIEFFLPISILRFQMGAARLPQETPPRLRGGSFTINLDAKNIGTTQFGHSLDAPTFMWWEPHLLPIIWHPRRVRGDAPAA